MTRKILILTLVALLVTPVTVTFVPGDTNASTASAIPASSPYGEVWNSSIDSFALDMAITNSHVYYATGDGVYKLNVSTGNVEWDTGTGEWDSVYFHDGALYAHSDENADGRYARINDSDGSFDWTQTLGSIRGLTVNNDQLVIAERTGSNTGIIYTASLSDGSRTQVATSPHTPIAMDSTPGGDVWVVEENPTFRRFDPATWGNTTGSLPARALQVSARDIGGASFQVDTTVRSIHTVDTNGNKLNSFKAGNGENSFIPYSVNGTVWFSHGPDYLVKWDPVTNTTLQNVSVGITLTPLRVLNGSGDIYSDSRVNGNDYALRLTPEDVGITVSGFVKNQSGAVPGATVEAINTTSGSVVESTTTGSMGFYSVTIDRDVEHRIEASKDGSSGSILVNSSTDVTNANITLSTPSVELVVRRWIEPGTNQSYIVEFTNKTGTFDVTSSANVTSDNTSVVTVNEANALLEGASGVNDTANVTAEYNGINNTVEITVATRTLDNIGIMPPPEWPCTFLGCGDTTGGHNIGSSMQWLWLIIVIMVAATRFSENPFAGVGTGIVFSILVWVLEYIDLGAVLITVFSGLLIGGLMARTQMGRGVTRDNEEAARISAGGKDQP